MSTTYLESQQTPLTKTRRFVPLRIIFIVPYFLLIAVTIASVGYLSFLNGQAAVNNVAHQLRSDITSRLQNRLLAFLKASDDITQFNADTIGRGLIDPTNVDVLHQYFLDQVRIHPSVSSIYFGNTEGGIIGSGREGPGGSLYIYNTETLNSGTFRKYGLNDGENLLTLSATVPNFDARTRPWYINAVQKGDAAWSSVYVLITGQDMAIAASRPVYNRAQQLMGVISVDIFLSQVTNFLETVNITPNEQSFIIEQSGLLIAASNGENLFTKDPNTANLKRFNIQDSTNTIIRASAVFLVNTFGSIQNIPFEQRQLEFTANGERQFLQLLPIQDHFGLNWIGVVVIPESTFMSQIDANNRSTLLIIIIGLVASISISAFISQKVTQPISQLNRSVQALAKGEWHEIREPNGQINELNGLASSFNQMQKQLRNTLDNLTSEITERKHAEATLRTSEEKYRLLFEAVSDAIIIVDAETRYIIDVNGEALSMYGFSRAELLNLRVEDISYEREETLNVVNELQLGIPLRIPIRYNRKKDGTKFPIELSLNTLILGDRRLICAVIRDITKRMSGEEELTLYRRNLEELVVQRTMALQIANERLEALSQVKDNFVANVSHELRTPIANLKLRQYLLMRQPDELNRHLEVMGRETERLWRMIEDLLQLSRLDQNHANLSMNIVNINTITQCYVSDRKALAEAKELEIVFMEQHEPLFAMADEGLLEQALSILFTNAINYTPSGGKITVKTISMEAEGRKWVGFSVSDTGPGIQSEDQARLFERFFRGTASSQSGVKGTGLGLSIAKEIIDQHDGKIEIESTGISGEGACFTIWLPAWPFAQPEKIP